MKLLNFTAATHASGGRIDVSWEIYPDPGERLADSPLPVVRVRRKTRDFMFPPEGAGDSFQLYDGATFHASRTLAPQFATENGLRLKVVREGEDVTREGETVFALRRAVSTYLTPQGDVHHVRVRIVDRGPAVEGLTPQTIYYYQIFGDLVSPGVNPAPYRATAQASEFFGFGGDLYRLLPAIHQQYDEKRELQNFLAIFGEQLDLLRSLAEGLRGLRDVDNCGWRLLPILADWIGWSLNYGAPIPLQRHEIKYAAALYRITGTIPGCMIWVKRLTGWEPRIKEFYRNVFFTNNLGNPDDPTDRGSRTIDTSDPQVAAALGTFTDEVDYTYDTGATEQDWYAYNVVGIFIKLPAGESATTVQRKATNLKNNLSLFLPVNIRGVVILEAPTADEMHKNALDLLKGSSDTTA